MSAALLKHYIDHGVLWLGSLVGEEDTDTCALFASSLPDTEGGHSSTCPALAFTSKANDASDDCYHFVSLDIGRSDVAADGYKLIYPRGWMNGLHFPGEQPMNRYLIPWEYGGGQLEPIVTATGESARRQDELPDEAEKPRKRKRVI